MNISYGSNDNADDDAQSFFLVDSFILRSSAWLDTSPSASKVLITIMCAYNGANNGNISYSVRQLAEDTGICMDTVRRALEELQEKGFIECTHKGSFDCKMGIASTWRLTMFECDDKPATKEFMCWRPIKSGYLTH